MAKIEDKRKNETGKVFVWGFPLSNEIENQTRFYPSTATFNFEAIRNIQSNLEHLCLSSSLNEMQAYSCIGPRL